MYRDRCDLVLTAASEAAAAAYRHGVDLLLSAWTGAAEELDRAIANDPGFALAYVARARLHQMHAQMADACAKAAKARSLSVGLTRRERQHIEIIAAAIEGKPAEARAAADEHLEHTLLVAYLRGGHLDRAQRAIDHRLHHRPSTRDQAWLARAAAYDRPDGE